MFEISGIVLSAAAVLFVFVVEVEAVDMGVSPPQPAGVSVGVLAFFTLVPGPVPVAIPDANPVSTSWPSSKPGKKSRAIISDSADV